MSSLRHLLIIPFLGLGLLCRAEGQRVCLRISDQASFGELNGALREALASPATDVEVRLDPGVYYFREGHLDLDSLQAPGKRLSIIGYGATLYPVLDRQGEFDVHATYFEEAADSLRPVTFPSELKRARFFVIPVNLRKKICRLRIDRELGSEAIRSGYIYLTEWFRGKTYKITGVKGRHVYFHADDLFQKRLLYNVNFDWTFSLQYPRYRLINCGDNSVKSDMRKASASSFLSMHGANLDSLALVGLRFVGNRHEPGPTPDALIRLSDTKIPTDIRHCRFEQIRTDCIRLERAASVSVRNCAFNKCFRYCVYASMGTSDIVIEDNRVNGAGLCGDNVFVFRCCSDGFRISRNTISDFGYGAISSGIHYTIEKTCPVRGSITANEIFYSPSYRDAAPRQMLMDSGAIYISTQLDSLLISDNYVHDIDGPTYNRGIFADDGASNVYVVGNRVERILNYYAIDIDPRSSWKLHLRRDRKVEREDISTGNLLLYNEVEGRIRYSRKTLVKGMI